jgi:hypothetical protein
MLVKTVAGIGFGLVVGFAIAFAWAETRVIDGVSRRVVQFEVNEYWDGTWDFPADLVPHRVVGKGRLGDLLLESDAFDFGLRLGLLYALEGAVLGVALAFGAKASKVVATGLIAAILLSLLPLLVLRSLFDSRNYLPLAAMIVFLALVAACGEAVNSAMARRRK